jgi:hypothetical protein
LRCAFHPYSANTRSTVNLIFGKTSERIVSPLPNMPTVFSAKAQTQDGDDFRFVAIGVLSAHLRE